MPLCKVKVNDTWLLRNLIQRFLKVPRNVDRRLHGFLKRLRGRVSIFRYLTLQTSLSCCIKPNQSLAAETGMFSTAYWHANRQMRWTARGKQRSQHSRMQRQDGFTGCSAILADKKGYSLHYRCLCEAFMAGLVQLLLCIKRKADFNLSFGSTTERELERYHIIQNISEIFEKERMRVILSLGYAYMWGGTWVLVPGTFSNHNHPIQC